MSFSKDNSAYEAWLACDVVAKDVDYKHHRMKKSAFIFLRATYFRWARKIGGLCPELMTAPPVLSVGDLHLENFGTWRDADGRLVWGVNDFDEAAVMPYPLDLVRLAASIRLAPGGSTNNQAAAALLDEGETWLRPYALGADDKPEKFWKEVADYPKAVPPRKIAERGVAEVLRQADHASRLHPVQRVPARPLRLPVLLGQRRSHLRSHHSAQQGRPDHLGKRRRRLFAVQPAQGQPDAAAGADVSAATAVRADGASAAS